MRDKDLRVFGGFIRLPADVGSLFYLEQNRHHDRPSDSRLVVGVRECTFVARKHADYSVMGAW